MNKTLFEELDIEFSIFENNAWLSYDYFKEMESELKKAIPKGSEVKIAANSVGQLCSALVALDGWVSSIEWYNQQEVRLDNICGIDITYYPNYGVEDYPSGHVTTFWKVPTSGTTGIAKSITKTFDEIKKNLTRKKMKDMVMGFTFDHRRFAGIQVIVQAMISGSRLVPKAETGAKTIARWKDNGVNHLSATNTQLLTLSLSPIFEELPFKSITLGGEIVTPRACQYIAEKFPNCKFTSIYATTENGVISVVKDGLPGFKRSDLQAEYKIYENRIYLKNRSDYPLTEDLIYYDDKNDRYHFNGRKDDVVVIAGTNVNKKQLELMVSNHAYVKDCQILIKPNPFSGNALICDILLEKPDDILTRQTITELNRIASETTGIDSPISVYRKVDELKLSDAGKKK